MVTEGSSKVKVAVRVRPLNKRELDCGTDIVIDMQDDQTYLRAPKFDSKKSVKAFTFDHCFWSLDESNEDKFASQEHVYQCLGTDVLANGFNGYNACIFAYGQTGSGKSYTMMGSPNQKGLIPRICDELFERINKNEDESMSYKVEVSYMEIYNEKVRDLLGPKSDKHNLKVREHNILGPYVDGLSSLVVNSFNDIEMLMSEGNKSRTVAATMMNAESSRSHAVFNVTMTQSQYDEAMQARGERVSKLSLVDLAGSERAAKTGAAGDRLKEGSNINKSLTTLGLVISALADQASGKQKKNGFVPYRDSVLTWLLKDNLGGNSRTVMVATISPSGDNYEETLSTLRYADRAKRIENHAVINEDPNAKLIRELREEIEQLKSLLTQRGLRSSKASLQEQLHESERLMHQASLTWEEKEQQTEQIRKERHQMLEKMGISIQDSGIAVEKNRYYLVNLNADPTLNELLVYYLKDHTKVGRQDASVPQDIQLTGLGILAEHSIIDVEDDTAYLLPLMNARTCINGQVVTDRTQLRHGDRILWGNNHFFRINCPHSVTHSGPDAKERIDFDFAHNELMMNEFESLGEPVQAIIQKLEENHEKEKQGALNEQKEMYEQKLEELRNEKSFSLLAPAETSLTDGRASSGYVSTLSSLSDDRLLGTPSSFYDRELAYEDSMRRLREDIIRANVLVREANQLSVEMKKEVDFAVTLQIPTASLSQGMSQGRVASEVAIVVKHRSRGSQVWSVDKLCNKIFDMRDAYQTMIENQHSLEASPVEENDDALFFEWECHTLVGVAIVWLQCLYQDVALDYSAPIISQQGDVCGKLSVEIKRLHDESSSVSADERNDDDECDNEGLVLGSTVQVQITVKEAIGLPLTLSDYVFCQYMFFDQPLTVVPPLNAATVPIAANANSIPFENTKIFHVDVDDEFLDYVTDGSLTIEVYGNRCQGLDAANASWLSSTNENGVEKTSADRWRDLSRRLEMWVEIHELNDQGFYSPVELQLREGQESGGVFLLRQGFSRRIVVQFVVPKVGNLPVVVEGIPAMAVGSVSVRMKNDKGLDSYQETDLQMLRDRFSDAVMKRKEYLDRQIQAVINRPNKTQADKAHESFLIDQWVSLTEERDSILCPVPGSGVPGAVMPDWSPLPGMEHHIPVIFLDLDDNALSGCADIEAEPAGSRSFLFMEQGQNILELPMLKYDQKRVIGTASWDSSIHDSLYLNRVTPNNERVYIILKVVVRLSSPALVNVVLRKRVCIRIYKRPSMTDSLRKKFWSRSITSSRCGLTFELISHIPRCGELSEEREVLARNAARAMHGDVVERTDADAIVKYNKGVSLVGSILSLDKLRQEVRVKEKLAAIGRSSKSLTACIRKEIASTPDVLSSPSMSNFWEASNESPVSSDMTAAATAAATTRLQETPRHAIMEAPPSMIRGSLGVDSGCNRILGSQITESRRSCFGFETLNVSNEPKSLSVIAATSGDTLADRRTHFQIVSPPLRSRNDAIPCDGGLSNPRPVPQADPSTDSPLVASVKHLVTVRRSLSEEFVGADDIVAHQASPQSNFFNDPAEARQSVMSLKLDELGLKDDPLACKIADHVVSTSEAGNDGVSVPVDSGSQSALRIGDVVSLGDGKQGRVRFQGRTQFADGIWVGLELTTPKGKNDGSVMGVQYFNCRPSHGLFIRADKLAKPDS